MKNKKVQREMNEAAGRDPLCPAHVYDRIRRLREQHGLSQKEVAASLGISQQSYSQYERGIRPVHIDLFVGLAFLYDTSVDHILGFTNLVSRQPES